MCGLLWMSKLTITSLCHLRFLKWDSVDQSPLWGRLEVGKFRAHVGCLEMGQTTLTWLGTAHTAPFSFIIGWEPPGPALPWDSVGFKGTWKGKARSLGQRPHLCPPCPLLLPFPHLAGWVTPLLSIKLSYLTPTTCSAWIFFHLEHKTRIFWWQTAPALLTLVCLLSWLLVVSGHDKLPCDTGKAEFTHWK
jgi:hypothetical protein